MDERCKGCLEIESINDDIKELKATTKEHSGSIGELKESQAESKVYVKQILERLDDLKLMFMSKSNDVNTNTDKWQKVVLELIKAIGTIAAVIAGIKMFK